jgi:hypothetical protein
MWRSGVRIDPIPNSRIWCLQTLLKVASFKIDLAIHFRTFPLLLVSTFNSDSLHFCILFKCSSQFITRLNSRMQTPVGKFRCFRILRAMYFSTIRGMSLYFGQSEKVSAISNSEIGIILHIRILKNKKD